MKRIIFNLVFLFNFIILGAVAQPMPGSTVNAKQSGTWTVQPGNTANTTAWKVDGSAVTQPVSGTFWQATQPVSLAANQSVNVAQVNGVTPLMGNGVTGTGSQRVTIASDNTAFTVNAAQSGTWTVQPGNTANTTPWLVNSAAIVGGGYDQYTFGGLVGTVQTVKGTAATLGGYYIFNPAATVCYLQIFDVASATSVTLGTTAPTRSLGIPAGAAANIPAVRPGTNFANGIKIAATTTRAGAVACGTGMDVNIDYK